ncbi:uncharacterized protein LOC134265636 [Saccostrea cucullata]|uniref:uncharacterized protein LOC134265636 n=1 Tax=Saccostrea cuccullata TaxID=36930 RepID=UPI002ED41D87
MAFKNNSVVMYLLVILLFSNPCLLIVKGDDSQCWAINGRCLSVNEPCFRSIKRYCDGEDRKCCLPGADYKCWWVGGTCQNISNFCRGNYMSGLCGGGVSRQCCV